jgi:hypothetical protein
MTQPTEIHRWGTHRVTLIVLRLLVLAAVIAFAKFDYKPLGVYLDIHRRNGQVDHLRFQPKMTSTELSGDPPRPDSAAYQITEWAQALQPPEPDHP